jgi:hypothetical protein
MLKVIGLASTIVLLVTSASPQRSRFSAYKAVEAYEVRPGILMMPTYSTNGQVCEIGIQKRNYSPDVVRVDSDLSRMEIDEILENLVPDNERGPKSQIFSGREVITRTGPGMTTNIDFENVSIQVVSKVVSGSTKRPLITEDVAAIIQWKNRKCE